MDTACELVLPLTAVRSRDLALVGAKAARLGDLLEMGVPVPDGFCLTVAAYEEFLQPGHLETSLRHLYNMAVQGGDLLSIANRAKSLISGQTFSPGLRDVIEQCFNELCRPSSSSDAVAARSSATAEDLDKASFAGIYESYLGLRSAEVVLDAVRNCWMSLWSERALLYRRSMGLERVPISGGVILQKMVCADAAGVLFTRGPGTHAQNMAIEVHAGPGEALVSGMVTPDRLILSRPVQGSYSQPFKLQSSFKATPALHEDDMHKLCGLGIQIERFYQIPQDVEWVKAGSELFVLQTRAITASLPTLDEVPDASVWTRDNLDERFPGPVKPLEASVVAEWVFTPGFTTLFRALHYDPSRGSEVFRTFDGYPYLNKQEIVSALHGLPAPILRQLFDRTHDQNTSPAKIALSRDLIIALMRIARIVYRHHKEFARAVEGFKKAYSQYHGRPLDGMTPEQLLQQLNMVGNSIKLVSSGHLQSIIAAEALFGVLSAIVTPETALKLISNSPCGLYENQSVTMEKCFEELVKEARLDPEVFDNMLTSSAQEVLLWIRQVRPCTYFSWMLDRFLTRYGHRATSYPLSHPRWAEQPEQVVELIKNRLADPKRDEVNDLTVLACTEVAGACVQGNWLSSAALRTLVRYASIYGTLLRENEGFYITMPFPDLKRILSALAERFEKASAIATNDDLYFLTLNEIRTLGMNLTSPTDFRALIGSRKQQRQGAASGCGAGSGSAAGVFRGTPASPGLVEGTVSILQSPAEPFQPGNILVTHTLNAAWLPILRMASGVITDLGGILSHAAVLTREFGIPAVLGVSGATATLLNGQRISVDGSRGEIGLLHIGGAQ